MRLDPEQTRVLIDHRGSIFKIRIMEIFDRPHAYRQSALSTRFRVAQVFKQIGSEEQFYETVCANRGDISPIFSDYDKAMNWLMSPDSQNDL